MEKIEIIGNLWDYAANPEGSVVNRIPLSEQLKREREILFSKPIKLKPRGKYTKRLTNSEIYYRSGKVSQLVAAAFNVDISNIFEERGLPRYTAIAICYKYHKFTGANIAKIFNCDRKMGPRAYHIVNNRSIIDNEYGQILQNIIKESENI